ncbi:MAG TPA: lytic transglycosylase domain-containing protein [Candidatus Cybelea sp.]|jgi:soluble lytic murein transglycosylase-like protein|nr:lytic transglycosylase domain-containing protein [Candidatus Cybelea sp.]
MEIVSELAAIERRIEAISAGPVQPSAEFGAILGASSKTISRPAIEALVRSNADGANVDPELIDAIISNESGFDPNAISSAGARGLMQLMPETAASLGVGDPYDPAQNVAGGVRYLRGLLDRFGDVELAVAAYNAGPAAVERYGGVPPFAETRNYVRNVLARYRQMLAQR